MKDLLEQVERGLQSNLYYLSLFAALTIPDICAALSSADGETTGPKYMAWFDKYVAPRYKGTVNGQICWFYRCSVLHQGSSQHPKSPYKRIIFLEPSGNILHNNILNDALNIDVRIFCADIVAGARAWLAENENTETFQANYPKFIHRHANGIAPYIVGAPVIG